MQASGIKTGSSRVVDRGINTKVGLAIKSHYNSPLRINPELIAPAASGNNIIADQSSSKSHSGHLAENISLSTLF